MKKITIDHLMVMAKETGFTYCGSLDPATIKLKQEVREMCSSGRCTQYGRRWSCPPGCGSLSSLREILQNYTCGVLVQSVAELEDEFDAETIMETESLHKERFIAMRNKLQEIDAGALAIGTGCCTVCAQCTYPDAPCLFPDKKISSMEAFGMLVSDICAANRIPYYYGRNTIAYTSCFLLK